MRILSSRRVYQEDISRIIDPYTAQEYIKSCLNRTSNRPIFGLNELLFYAGIFSPPNTSHVNDVVRCLSPHLVGGTFFLLDNEEAWGEDSILFFGRVSHFLPPEFIWSVERLPKRPCYGSAKSGDLIASTVVQDGAAPQKTIQQRLDEQRQVAYQDLEQAEFDGKSAEVPAFDLQEAMDNPASQGINPVPVLPIEQTLAVIADTIDAGLSVGKLTVSTAVNVAAEVVSEKLKVDIPTNAGKEVKDIIVRRTNSSTRLGGVPGEPAVKIIYKDGTEFDMTRTRVKETEVNPYKPERKKPKIFENALDKKGHKRAPTEKELQWFESYIKDE